MPKQELHYQNEMPTKTAQNLHNQIQLNTCSMRSSMSIKIATEVNTTISASAEIKTKMPVARET
jgi:hypothetical protein